MEHYEDATHLSVSGDVHITKITGVGPFLPVAKYKPYSVSSFLINRFVFVKYQGICADIGNLQVSVSKISVIFSSLCVVSISLISIPLLTEAPFWFLGMGGR